METKKVFLNQGSYRTNFRPKYNNLKEWMNDPNNIYRTRWSYIY